MNIIINLPCIKSMAWGGRSAFLLLFVDKLSISVFLAAAGSTLNVSSLPFLLSYEGGQSPRDIPSPTSLIRELVPSLIHCCKGSCCQFCPTEPYCLELGMFQMSWQTFLEKKRQHPTEATKRHSTGFHKRMNPQSKKPWEIKCCPPWDHGLGLASLRLSLQTVFIFLACIWHRHSHPNPSLVKSPIYGCGLTEVKKTTPMTATLWIINTTSMSFKSQQTDKC